MKLYKLEDNKNIEKVTASVFKSKENKLYYTVKHGTQGFWIWSCGILPAYFKPKTENDEIVLEGDNYTLVGVSKNNLNLRDRVGNNFYNLGRCSATKTKNDILLFWTLPVYGVSEKDLKIRGRVSMIGRGLTGIVNSRGKKKQSVAPVLRITGNCCLEWRLKRYNSTISQVIIFKENRFHIGKLKVENNEKI